MQELIQKIIAAAGTSEEQARKSIEAVSEYIKNKLPESFKSQIDNLVNGGTLSAGVKSKLSDVAGDFREKAEDVIKDVRDKAEDAVDKIKDLFDKKDEK